MIVVGNKCGQLGNRLFAFAHFVANAIEHNHTVVNMSFDEYSKWFVNTRSDVFCRYPVKKSFLRSEKLRSTLFIAVKATLKLLRKTGVVSSALHKVFIADLPEYQFNEPRSYDLNLPEFQHAARSKPVCFTFGRFFRDYRNFEKHEHAIRSFFKPVDHVSKMVESVMTKARSEADLVVGVHIRKGDYAAFAGGRYLYSQETYAVKMREVAAAFSGRRVSFVVCSNEAINVLEFAGMQVINGPGHLVADMYTLAECDYIMGPPSTYTLWASFYGNKPIYQMREVENVVTATSFTSLPPEILFNFSFN